MENSPKRQRHMIIGKSDIFPNKQKRNKIKDHTDNSSLKKIQNAPRTSSEHPPQSGGGKCQNALGGVKGCKYKTSSWHLNGFPMIYIIVTLGQQYNIGEKPTDILLYTYIINRHTGRPEKQRKKTTKNMVLIIYCT